MRIWILTVGEPLPTDEGNARLLRSGIMAQLAADMGHEVVWFTSTLDHTRKSLRYLETTSIELGPRYEMCVLHGGDYKRNVSIKRLINHFRIGLAFRREAEKRPAPDVIVCSMPLIEMAHEAARIKKRHPATLVVQDIRDYWPEIWAEAMPKPLRLPARVIPWPWEYLRNRALRQADRVIGITDEAVNWACQRSGRVKTAADQGVPMAYQLYPLTDEMRREADAFWREKNIHPGDLTVCFLGTLTNRFADLIAAFRLLPGDVALKIRLVLAGTGESANDLKATAKDLPNIVFPGWIDAPKIARLMEISKAGLLPYPNTRDFMDSLPNKSIEYLAGALPIVSCLRGKVGDLIAQENCGFSYTEGDPASLAHILTLLAQQTGRFDEYGQNARKIYENRFRPEKVYGDLINSMAYSANQAQQGVKLNP